MSLYTLIRKIDISRWNKAESKILTLESPDALHEELGTYKGEYLKIKKIHIALTAIKPLNKYQNVTMLHNNLNLVSHVTYFDDVNISIQFK